MSPQSKREYFEAIYKRYKESSRKGKKRKRNSTGFARKISVLAWSMKS